MEPKPESPGFPDPGLFLAKRCPDGRIVHPTDKTKVEMKNGQKPRIKKPKQRTGAKAILEVRRGGGTPSPLIRLEPDTKDKTGWGIP